MMVPNAEVMCSARAPVEEHGRRPRSGRRSRRPRRLVTAVVWSACGAAASASEEPAAAAASPWVPEVELEDYECRRHLPDPVVNWTDLRGQFNELTQRVLDPGTLRPAAEDPAGATWRKAMQVELLGRGALVLMRFPQALAECPMGAAVVSLFITCLANLPRDDVAEEPLPHGYEMILADVGRQRFQQLASRDLRLLLDIAMLHVTAAAEWNIFAMLNFYIGRLRLPAEPGAPVAVTCPGTGVSGHSSEKIRELLSRHMALASGKSIEGLKFLRGLDDLVTSIMRDPTEFSHEYVEACPAGAAAFAVTAAMLALMSNPSLFERFSSLAHFVMRGHMETILTGAAAWGVFHALAKMAIFATRSYDLVWSLAELLPVPADPKDFDELRLNAARRIERLDEASRAHPYEATRSLASFLSVAARRQAAAPGARPETVVYLTAVGGPPFSDHIVGFIRQAVAVGLPALLIACMDPEAFSKCRAVVGGKLEEAVHCISAFEGHVVLVKHAFIPVLLSAAVDTVWIDFDTFILRDPTDSILDARDHPSRVFPERSRVRYGSFLFHNASDLCHLTKVCDPRQHWSYTVSGEPDAADDTPVGTGVEVLVTEHWDARCLNNGLFYVRASHRPLIFFVMFLTKLYTNPYTDNQNLFDAFLGHSSIDSAAPESRPLLRYALLDIEHRFACAEGHTSTVADIATFHFWSSDFATREVADAKTGSAPPDVPAAGEEQSTIRLRDGKERVSKTSATKAELFEIFFGEETEAGEIPPAGAAFIESVRTPPPNWKGMCAVTAVGIEDLVDEKMVQEKGVLLDWKKAAAVPESGPSQLAQAAAQDNAQLDRAAAARGADVADGPQCSGIPLKDWADGLRWIAVLEDASLLGKEEVTTLKARLRHLDVGTLLVVQAYEGHGRERLAVELKAALVQDAAGGAA